MNKKFYTVMIITAVALSVSAPLFADGKKQNGFPSKDAAPKEMPGKGMPPKDFDPKDMPKDFKPQEMPKDFNPDMKMVPGHERGDHRHPAKNAVFRSIEGKIKVEGTKADPVYYIETSEGKFLLKYNKRSPEADEIIKTLKKSKNKKITISGFLNPKENIFQIVKIGEMDFKTEPVNPKRPDTILK